MKIKDISTGLSVLKGVAKVKIGKPVPIFCQWEITYDCNMRCTFCCVKKHKNLWRPETTTGEAIDIIDQLSELGTRILNFSGGEPTLRKDIPILIDRAKKRGMKVFFSTNGHLIRKRADDLLKADLIRFSIDGTKNLHDKLRKYSGAFENSIKGIKILKSKGANVMINTVVTSETPYETMKDITKIAESLGVQISFSMVFSGLQTIENPTKNMLDREQTDLKPDETEFISNVRKLKREFKGVVANPESYLKLIKNGGLGKFGCRAMDITIAIKPNGAVSMPCGDFPMKALKGRIKNIYYSKEADKIRRGQGKYWFCNNCYIRCMSFPTMLLDFKSLLSIIKSWREI